MLLFIFKLVILLRIIHFLLHIQKKKLKLLVITGLLHILAQIIIFKKRLFFVISRCLAAYFGNFRI